MKYLGKLFILIIINVLILSSCKTGKEVSVNNDILIDTLSEEKKFEFDYQFFEANRYFLDGNYELSLKLFNNCLKIDPYSAVVYYKIASIYLGNNELELAQLNAEKAMNYNPDNVWYLYLAGNIFTKNNEIEKAINAFSKLIKLEPNEIDFYINLADIHIKNKDLKGAIGVYDNIEQLFGISEVISLQKHKIYLAANNNKDALEELKKLSNKFPSNVKFKRYIGEFYLKSNEIDEAIKCYNNILLEHENDGYSNIGLSECYRLKGDFKNSINQLKLAFESKEVESDMKFQMLLSIIQNAGNDQNIQNASFELTEILYNKYPDNADVATVYANFLLQKSKLKEASKILEKVILIRKDKYPVWEQLILLDNEFSDWEKMFKHTDEALKYFPNQSFLYFFNGFSSFQLFKYDKAISSLSFGYKLITKDDELRNDFMTFLGEAYYKTGEKSKAYKIFDDILTDEPDNLMVLNNYAYYLSTDEISLDKAEKMSKITIDTEPFNATYLDTYAWILFKKNMHKEALKYIELAIKNDDDVSDVVLEHYGDILYKNDRIEDALVQWKNAKNIGEGSGLLEQKINEQKYIK